MLDRLQKLLLQIHRSKGAFQVHRWEEEEELFSVHVRFCILIWLSLSLSVEMIREVFFSQLSPLYEPFILAGFIAVYHFVRVRGRRFIWALRGAYFFLPVFVLFGERNREEGYALLHQMEAFLLDQGISFWHFGNYTEPGFQAEVLFAAFLLWGIILYYEIGKKKRGTLFLFPAVFYMAAVLFLGWEAPWWICPLLLLQALLLFMPSFFAWGVFACVGGCLVILISRLPALQQSAPSGLYQKWESWRYEEDQAALPQGDMNKVWKLVREDETALTVETAAEGPFYLKGFVGVFYDGDHSWNHERAMARAVEQGVFGSRYDIIDLLGERGFYGNYILMNHSKIRKTKSLKFQVTNLHANRKYLYLPYESKTRPSAYEEQASLTVGEQLVAQGLRGQRDYECNVISSLAGKTGTIVDKEKTGESEEDSEKSSSPVKRTGEIYRDYVDRVYLSIPKSSSALLTDVLSEDNMAKSTSLAGTVAMIRTWMQANITYTEEAAPIPKGEEFLSWLLEEEKRGNDIYYAACGTLLFRYYGIPARYVEGYLYNGQNGGEVLQSDAHAWTEIYYEGLGWIPVELCEKYQSEIPSYLPEEVSKGTAFAVSEEEEETEEKEEETEEESEETMPEETDTAMENTQDKPEPLAIENQKKEESSLVKEVFSAVFHGGSLLLLGLLFLGMAVLILGALAGLFWYFIREGRWQKTGSSPVCIVEWQRHVRMCLYLLEEVKEVPFDQWDNRNSTLEQLLRKHDEGFEQKELAACFLIYQIALYSPKSISWNQRKQFVLFFRQTRKRLKRKLKATQRLRLIYDRNFI